MGPQGWPRDPSEDSVERFARDLKALRTATGRSLRDVVRKGAASHDSIHQAERGRRLPTAAITAAYVRGAGGSGEDVTRWTERCERLRHYRMLGASAPAITPENSQSGHPELHAQGSPATSEPSEPAVHKLAEHAVPACPAKTHEPASQGFQPSQEQAPSPAVSPPEAGRSEGAPREPLEPDPTQVGGSPSRRHLTFRGTPRAVREGPGSRTTLNATAGLVIVIVAVIASLLLFRGGILSADRPPTAPASPSTSVRFHVPQEGDTVASPFLARGTAEPPPNTALWLLTQPPDGAYYPVGMEPVAVDASGEWVASVSIGRGERDIGLAYDLHAVVVPASGSSMAEAVAQASGTGSSARFDSLPADIIPAARVHVILGKRGP